jgi:hypothetical protein
VGSILPLGGEVAGQVIDPQGKTVFSLSDSRRAQSVKLDQVGIYQVYTADQEALVAVNTDPRESDLAPMNSEVLARWRQAAATAPRATTDSGAATAAPPLELWRLLLPLLILAVLAESMLGNTYLRRGSRAAA